MDDEDYEYDAFDDGSSKQVGLKHVSDVKDFLRDYSAQLRDIEEALSESLSDIWDANQDPISLSVHPYEQTNILELVSTENKMMNKIFMVFAFLCKECATLVQVGKTKFYPGFLLFGQESREDPSEGEAQEQIGRMLPFLMELKDFVDRANEVVKNIIHQLSSLYRQNERMYQQTFKNVHLNTVFVSLSELLACLETLDEIIVQNHVFKLCWTMYKRMSKNIKADPERYGTDAERMLQFEKLLLSIEGQLLDGLIFQNCIEQEFDFPGVVAVRTNQLFDKEFIHNIKTMFTRMASKSGDLNEIYQRRRFLGLCCLYAFYHVLFKNTADKKFYRSLWDLHRTIPVVHLVGNVVWFPNIFLTKKTPFMAQKVIGNVDVRKFQMQYTAELEKTLEQQINNHYIQVTMWMVRMESNMTNRADIRKILNYRIGLILTGLRLAYELGDLFKQYIFLHSHLKIKLKQSRIPLLCKCIEIIKAIQFTFHRKSATMGESIAYIVQQMQFVMQRQFFPIKDKLEQPTNKYSDVRLDILAAVNLAMQMLNGCASDDRRLLLRLSSHVVFQSTTEDQVDMIKDQCRRLDLICNLEQSITEACDCSFFYWSRILVPSYLEHIFDFPNEAHKLQYMFAAFRDIVPLFAQSVHVEPSVFLQVYSSEVEGALESIILTPLCNHIEQDLRYHIHTHLKVSDRDPFREGVKNLSLLVNLKPLRFFDRLIDFKAHVTHYLDTIFYNLTTVALYDWKTYAEMRNLAREKYGLQLMEVHLPGQTLEQGVDVLEIMRNIHIFVAKYYYNLNNQVFIEKQSDGKFLNTVNIGHIANSLRTHGAGIMNTTVNFTYQFLRQKFMIFSQFLYDDHIKSRLYKDIRFYRDEKDKLDNMYPFERAEKFNQQIRKLGLTDDQQSYLDQFRLLITQIGNAMGYVRLVRSGGLQYISNAIKFIPDLQDVALFEEMVNNAGLPESTQVAARNLDNTLQTLVENFSEGTDYFKILVKAFASVFQNETNQHLRNFYIIVPPLTLNFVSHMVIVKDKKQQKGKKGREPVTCFTDDGFAIGIAYILKLLNQTVEFDSLHWFESIEKRFNEQNAKLTRNLEAQRAGKKIADNQQTALLTLRKNQALQAEFRLLKFSFSGARIFFKD